MALTDARPAPTKRNKTHGNPLSCHLRFTATDAPQADSALYNLQPAIAVARVRRNGVAATP